MTLDYGISPYWECCAQGLDYMFLTGDYMVPFFKEKGYKDKQLLVTGIPVADKFSNPIPKESAREILKLDKNLFTIDDLIKTNMEIQNQLQLYDITSKLDYFYFCSHHPTITPNCICRKPKPYLIQKACGQLDIDVTQSFMIGDKLSDVQCGNNANCKNSFLIDKNNTLYDITRNLLN